MQTLFGSEWRKGKTRRRDEGGSFKSKSDCGGGQSGLVSQIKEKKYSASWLATQTLKQRRLTLDIQKEKDNEDRRPYRQ